MLWAGCLRMPGLLPQSLWAGGIFFCLLAAGLTATVVACQWRNFGNALAPAGRRGWAHFSVALPVLLLLGHLAARLAGTGQPAHQPPASGHQWIEALFMLFVAGLVAPWAEELALRFTIFRLFRAFAGFIPSALVSSAVFALLHWTPDGGLARAGLAGLAGLALCWSYEGSGSLRTPLLVHCAANLVLFDAGMPLS